MAKKKAKSKNYFEVVQVHRWKEWLIAVCIGDTYKASGHYIYTTYASARRAAKRLSALTGWPVVEK